jgi:hypothetical protein
MDTNRFNRKAGDIVPRSAFLGDEFVEFQYFLPKDLPNIKEIKYMWLWIF